MPHTESAYTPKGILKVITDTWYIEPVRTDNTLVEGHPTHVQQGAMNTGMVQASNEYKRSW